MTLTAQVLEKYPIQLDARTLRVLLGDVNREMQTYADLIKRFETQHGSDLASFEARLKRKEIAEHPGWEIAIEWGSATDELEKLKLIKRALEWILNFLN
ncbi:MAG: hypothetical protein HZC40_21135 [Chloroflexi bacterium]|nr:hypothetical protein [Chloroflexota bacterium]